MKNHITIILDKFVEKFALGDYNIKDTFFDSKML